MFHKALLLTQWETLKMQLMVLKEQNAIGMEQALTPLPTLMLIPTHGGRLTSERSFTYLKLTYGTD